jgi:outer membrane protein assembly factor BamB
MAAVAVGGGVAIGAFDRELGGLIAYDRLTGRVAWQLGDDLPIGINTTPIIAGDAAIVANSLDEVFAVDVLTGAVRWRTALDPRGFSWGNATIGTPVVGHGIAVVPTLYDDAVALDVTTGGELWRYRASPSPLHATHYRGAGEAGFAASPALADDVVWLAGTDGTIAAVNLWTGKELWHTTGPPVLAGLAIAGDVLIAASYDGTVRALAPVAPGAPLPAQSAAVTVSRCPSTPCDGCGPDAGGSSTPVGLVIALACATLGVASIAIGLALRARRARTRARAATRRRPS